MRHLLISSLLSTVLSAQGGGQPVNIPVPSTTFELGYGQSLSQDLGVTPQKIQAVPNQPYTYTDGTYTLQFSEVNHYPPYPGKWEAELTFGTQQLCDFYGWGTTGATVPLTCTSSAYIVVDQALPSGGPVQGGNDLVLTFTVNDGSSNGGWPVKFDNISLTFTKTD